MNEPVLLIGFNRPAHLARVIDRLREVRPTRVFLALDGARPNRLGEAELVRECRELAAAIDWSCELSTLFQERNLGCGLGVSTAIGWFFEHVERGIILEDDIVPDPTFFGFCSELLERYELDERVFAVSGCNFVPASHQSRPQDAYRFSQVPHIWGWATWRRSWARHSLDIAGWKRTLPPHRLLAKAGWSLPGTTYWAATFELLARRQVDTWDGQLVLASMAANQLTATSNVNLVRNIGFGEQATHTFVDRQELPEPRPIPLPTAPVDVACDRRADAWTRRHHFRATWRGMLYHGAKYLRWTSGR